MQRVTISVSDEFAAELAAFMTSQGYQNRSEAVRDLARLGLKKARIDDGLPGACVATLSYVYDHETRALSTRLTATHHANHDLQVATLHVHLDHRHCLEVAVLRGATSAVRDFAKTVIAEIGVKHGEVSFVPVRIGVGSHGHGSHERLHGHVHPIDG